MYVISLLHGTWANGAVWTNDQASSLRVALEHHFRGEVVFKQPSWTGLNRRSGRSDGAEQLKRHIIAVAAEYPFHLHYIIAHSHGGNVVTYALRDPDIKQKIAGVVCMATPFLVVKERDIGPYFIGNLEVTIGVLFALVLFLTCGFIVGTFPSFFGFLEYVPGGLYLLLIGVAIPFLLIAAKIHSLWKRVYDKTLQDLTVGAIDYELFIVREAGDEASLALAVAQFGSWFCGALCSLFARIVHKLEVASERVRSSLIFRWAIKLEKWQSEKHPSTRFFLIGPLALQIYAVIFIVSFIGFLDAEPWYSGRGLLFLFGIVASIISALMVYNVPVYVAKFVVGLLFLPFLLFGCFFLLPFGYDVTVGSFLLEIDVEVTPPGEWQVFQSRSLKSPGLRHSFVYDDPEVQVAISTWIRKRSTLG